MHPLLIFLSFLAINLFSTPGVTTTSGVDLQISAPVIDFGRSVDFAVNLQTSDPIQESIFYFQASGQNMHQVPFTIDSAGQANIHLDLNKLPIRPFAHVDYWVSVTLASQETYTSATQSFNYEDNHYTWQRLDQDNVQLAWVEGDRQFGLDALNTAQKAQANVDAILAASQKIDTVRIYIYPDAQALQNSLELTGTPWASGHASPDLGVILIAVAPGADQRSQLEQLLPHEWMHLSQYAYMGSAYTNLPSWFTEGLASMAELYPHAEYQSTVADAGEEDRLIPMAGLCGSFPNDLASAYQSYAQSESFVRYLYQNYGSSSLTRLMDQYKDGLGCEEGFRVVYEKTLPEMDADWRQSLLGDQYTVNVRNALLPYLIILGVLFIPLTITLLLVVSRRIKK